jgi:hypothetical protein
MMTDKGGAAGEIRNSMGNETIQRKPDAVSLCALQIKHDLHHWSSTWGMRTFEGYTKSSYGVCRSKKIDY